MKLLLVDDSKDVLEELNKTFELIKGLKIVGKAQTEDEALALFWSENPDVVCLDIRLQQGSGFNILKEIRKVDSTTIVFMLTNYPYPQYKKKCLDLGAEFFFDKSSELPQAVQILKELQGNAG